MNNYEKNNMMIATDTKNKIVTGIIGKMREELLNIVNGGDMYVCRKHYESYIDGTKNVLVTDEVDELEKYIDKNGLTLTHFMYYARLEIDDKAGIDTWLGRKIISLDNDINEIDTKKAQNTLEKLGL